MGLKMCVLGSGSKGNCTCVWGADTNLLIDDGLTLSRVEKCLKLFSIDPYSVSVLVTHAHADHVGGLLSLVKKYGVTVYVSERSQGELISKYRIPKKNLITFSEDDFFIGSFTLSPFSVSHDVPCVGFSLINEGKKISVVTDLGKISDRTVQSIADSDIVVLEANHDEDMLHNNENYSDFLKRRITSDRGHLSNKAAADCAVKLANGGVKQIILAHLSQENNLPELAFSTVRDRLTQNGINEDTVRIEVAVQDKMSGLYEIL